MALVHFDAHCDTWTDHCGEPSGHGTWTYEALQEGLVSPAHTVQIGLRSSGQRAAREYVRDQGGLIYPARDLRGLDGAALLYLGGMLVMAWNTWMTVAQGRAVRVAVPVPAAAHS